MSETRLRIAVRQGVVFPISVMKRGMFYAGIVNVHFHYVWEGTVPWLERHNAYVQACDEIRRLQVEYP